MYQLSGRTLTYMIDENGHCASFINRITGHEYIHTPGPVWKIIYLIKGTERAEVPIWADKQRFEAASTEKEIVLTYNGLLGEDGRKIDAFFRIRFAMTDEGLKVTEELKNFDPSVQIVEVQLTPVSKARSLNRKPEEDCIAWPRRGGIRVCNPAFSDLSTYAGFRKYERHDQFHTDLDALYQGSAAGMQWYDWYNAHEGLYCGSEDVSRQAVCLHVERDVRSNELLFGFIHYPMIDQGEEYFGPPIVFYPHAGDWHCGAKIYRKFMEQKNGFVPPVPPPWCRDMTGWERLIFKQHHGEINFDFSMIPTLYDEVEKAGMKTLYILGWETGGFARMWPDYVIDERMGGAKKLREGIDYVHKKGGKVILFLSYSLIDRRSDFYRNGPGRRCTIRSVWQEEVPFAETYCGEGTYRKIGNPPMPMYLACPGAPEWQEKMKDAARVCLEAGADGVLYDLGGLNPYFCFAQGHTHSKPSRSHEHKAENFKDLRSYVKSFGNDKIILMEHSVDVYGQFMDMAHSSNTRPDPWLRQPDTAEDPALRKQAGFMPEMYRYTFPELLMTNRECGEDEENFKAYAGYSFVMGLRFDMTIFRCCGTLSDIPHYTKHLKKLNAMYEKYADFLLRGRFVDQDGFKCDDPLIIAKGYLDVNGRLAAACWNPTSTDRTVILTDQASGRQAELTVPAEDCAVMILHAGE